MNKIKTFSFIAVTIFATQNLTSMENLIKVPQSRFLKNNIMPQISTTMVNRGSLSQFSHLPKTVILKSRTPARNLHTNDEQERMRVEPEPIFAQKFKDYCSSCGRKKNDDPIANLTKEKFESIISLEREHAIEDRREEQSYVTSGFSALSGTVIFFVYLQECSFSESFFSVPLLLWGSSALMGILGNSSGMKKIKIAKLIEAQKKQLFADLERTEIKEFQGLAKKNNPRDKLYEQII